MVISATVLADGGNHERPERADWEAGEDAEGDPYFPEQAQLVDFFREVCYHGVFATTDRGSVLKAGSEPVGDGVTERIFLRLSL